MVLREVAFARQGKLGIEFTADEDGGPPAVRAILPKGLASALPPRNASGGSSSAAERAGAWLLQGQRAAEPARATVRLCGLALVLCTVGCVVGTAGFIGHTATGPLALKWNGVLGIWTWGVTDPQQKTRRGCSVSSSLRASGSLSVTCSGGRAA